MDPVVHFEMPYEDRERAAQFYRETFGWKPQMLGEEMGNYVVMHTSEVDPATNFPKEPGRINGGFYKKPEDPMGQHPSVVIAVGDIEETLKKIAENGGKVLGEPMDIPGIGRYGSFLDTEGNRVSIIKPLPM
jgi:uncharacterized protein